MSQISKVDSENKTRPAKKKTHHRQTATKNSSMPRKGFKAKYSCAHAMCTLALATVIYFYSQTVPLLKYKTNFVANIVIRLSA